MLCMWMKEVRNGESEFIVLHCGALWASVKICEIEIDNKQQREEKSIFISKYILKSLKVCVLGRWSMKCAITFFIYNFRLLTATVEPCQIINCNCFSFSYIFLCMHLFVVLFLDKEIYARKKYIYQLHLNTSALHMNNLKIETFSCNFF